MSIFGKSEEPHGDDALSGLKERVTSAKLPLNIRTIVEREIGLLSKISDSSTEYAIGLTYLEYLMSLPWSIRTSDNLDLKRAERMLNERHYGLLKIKERILEHLAVEIMMLNRKPRILVVDDEEIAIKNLEHILIKEDYSVTTASSGVEAVRRLEESHFDVVMTDLRMEKIDGIGVIEKTKSRHPDTEVIMITGYASVRTAVESMKKGAFHYISKPFKLDEVRFSVKEALTKKFSAKTPRGSILCFAGPPGTGKTSLGRSIAEALGRKFARISLGGIKDEAEIRGHRRTYAGAMPGRIIEEIRRAGVLNPVLMLDEVDKVGGEDFKGDSSSALLEVLDPEQNHSFIDHYLDIPFDLSGVMFIATANVAEHIQEPLRDRMEIIEFSGYTEDEKTEIAISHLIPRQTEEKGLAEHPPAFTREAALKIIQEHTREAGIRDLERHIASILRKMASEFVHKGKISWDTVTPEVVEKLLGPREYYFEVADEKERVGVTTGLVRTDIGGDIIFIETAKMKGKGELLITGSIGNIMRESALAALSYIKSNADAFNIQEDFFGVHDIHVHIPAGAIPKDGPSAGAAIAIALLSLLMEKPVRRDIAISGEITLTGRLLPIGGIKEKLLAARRSGVKAVVVPAKNSIDIESLSSEVKNGLEIYTAERLENIIAVALK